MAEGKQNSKLSQHDPNFDFVRATAPRGRPPKNLKKKGTNVHSSVAGISVHNALMKLEPPSKDALPGSKELPWLRLTEWEMMNLRKRMKKNAKWRPSQDMIKVELINAGRGPQNYWTAKAEASARGSVFIDEDNIASRTPDKPLTLGEISLTGNGDLTPEPRPRNRGMVLNEAKKRKREESKSASAASVSASVSASNPRTESSSFESESEQDGVVGEEDEFEQEQPIKPEPAYFTAMARALTSPFNKLVPAIQSGQEAQQRQQPNTSKTLTRGVQPKMEETMNLPISTHPDAGPAVGDTNLVMSRGRVSRGRGNARARVDHRASLSGIVGKLPPGRKP